MKQITYATGRDYGKPQVLEITIEQSTTDDWGWVDFTAVFIDSARGIKGRVTTIALGQRDIGNAVLMAYDNGNYSAV